MTDQSRAERLAEIAARAEKATEGPWAIETCGEKGDGSDIVGVVFRPDIDGNCKQPLSGFLESYDDAGNEIEYYRDEEVAEFEHRTRNPHWNALFCAHARSDIPWLLSELEAADARRLTALNELRAIRKSLCECPLPYRDIEPEQHHESCPALETEESVAALVTKKTRLRSLLAEAREALRPFANHAPTLPYGNAMTFENVRRAAAVAAKLGKI